MPKIFISYRRADSLKDAGRLDDRLSAYFGRDNVFKDFESINKALPFAKVIQDALQVSDLILVVIGKQWATLRDEQNNIRLQMEDDLVRYEVRTGLERWREDKANVLPILVDDATMPKKAELPPDLHELVDLNAQTLQNDPYFHQSINNLFKEIEKLGFYPPTQVQAELFDIKQAVSRYYQYRTQNKFDDAREILARIREANLKLAGFELDVQEKDLWTAIQAKERDDNYALIRLIPETMPQLIQAQLEAFWQTYPNYDPDNLARFKRQSPIGIVPTLFAKSKATTKPSVKDLLPPPFEWCEIPAGKVTIEGKTETLPTFLIAKYPITNAQYAKFIDAGGYTNKKWWTEAGWKQKLNEAWKEPRYWRNEKFNGAEQPVVGVSWYESIAFCLWLRGASSEKILLPTEQQWQRAAQGDDGRAYPWGNEWDEKRCSNYRSNSFANSSPVRQYEGKGDSPFKVVDMAGNVWEWCLTEYETGENRLDGKRIRTRYGGSWIEKSPIRVDVRVMEPPEYEDDTHGFRIALNLE